MSVCRASMPQHWNTAGDSATSPSHINPRKFVWEQIFSNLLVPSIWQDASIGFLLMFQCTIFIRFSPICLMMMTHVFFNTSLRDFTTNRFNNCVYRFRMERHLHFSISSAWDMQSTYYKGILNAMQWLPHSGKWCYFLLVET